MMILMLLVIVSLLVIGRAVLASSKKSALPTISEASADKSSESTAPREVPLPLASKLCAESQYLARTASNCSSLGSGSSAPSPTFSDTGDSSYSSSAATTQPNTPNTDAENQAVIPNSFFDEQDITDANCHGQKNVVSWSEHVSRFVKAPITSPTITIDQSWLTEPGSIPGVLEADATSAYLSEPQSLIIPGLVLNDFELSRLFARKL